MKHNCSHPIRIGIRPLSVEEFRPYGWLLGKPLQSGGGVPSFSSADLDFRQEHVFDPGHGGETELLWVGYRNTQREVSSLEAHRLSQQAVVPLTGEVIQVVAVSLADGSPDVASARAFRVRVGQGVCMREGCWHTTRVDMNEVTCLMLTRRSTTVDLVAHLTIAASLTESMITGISRMVLAD